MVYFESPAYGAQVVLHFSVPGLQSLVLPANQQGNEVPRRSPGATDRRHLLEGSNRDAARMQGLLARHYTSVRPPDKGAPYTEQAVLRCILEAPRGAHGHRIELRRIAAQVNRDIRTVRRIITTLQGFKFLRRIEHPVSGPHEFDLDGLREALNRAETAWRKQ